jgi:predicted AAA+ superfamily ATPase
MELDILNEWNPWWEKKELVARLEGRPRPRYESLIKSVDIREITVITGVRRSGKSTLMYQMIGRLLERGVDPAHILFVNLEDKKLANINLDEIYSTYRENLNPDGKAYIFIDEIHRREGWESWIRKKYDLKTRDKFIISGSCSYLLRREYSTLLTGRNITFDVFPLSFGEFLLFRGMKIDAKSLEKGTILEETKLSVMNSLNKYMKFGGFPEIFFKDNEFKAKLLEQYFDDILYKDIIDRYNLSSQKAKDLALFLMTNFTGTVSLRGIRNSLGLSYDTTKDYLSYLTEAFLLFTMNHFSYSLKEQKTAASKVYCIDNGLRNAVSFKFSTDTGKLAENAVFVELKRREKDTYYWTNNGEVDFVIKNKDNSLTAINVSYSDDIGEREVKPLHEFKSSFDKTKELLILTKNTSQEKDGIKYVPLWEWFLKTR